MERVRLKRYNEIDFNKLTGTGHLSFDVAKNRLGNRIYLVTNMYACGWIKLLLSDKNGNKINNIWGSQEGFPKCYFKSVK